MTQENVRLEYQIILNQLLSDVEIARLKEREKQYGFYDVSYHACMIRMIAPETDIRDVCSYIANWLTSIGAEEDIFCIQEVRSFYTGFTLPEVKELFGS